MGDRSNIEWTDATWNPISGCDAVGPGCTNCYAESIAKRFAGSPAFPNGFGLTYRPHLLDQPLRWKRPRRIFVNSMSDLFHKHVVNPPPGGPIPLAALEYIFNRMEEADWHTYQILTKRSSLMRDWVFDRYTKRGHQLPPHIWLGVSVEDRAHIGRIEHLRDTPIHPHGVRFVSFEPLLGSVRPVDLLGIHWAIVGGESGKAARPIESDWVRQLREQCIQQGVALFFKQWGSNPPPDVKNDPVNASSVRKGGPKGGNVIDNRTHLYFPDRERLVA